MQQQAAHTITTGTILVSRWGYGQTNVDFYQVTRTTDKTVWFRPLKSQSIIKNQHAQTYWCHPVLSHWAGQERRVKNRGDHIQISSYQFARPWNGAPLTKTTHA